MTMGVSVRAALVAALRGDAALGAMVHHVDDGEAKSPPVPNIRLAEISAGEWGAKDRPGHELRIELLISDRGEGARLESISEHALAIIAAMPRTINGWETSGFTVLRLRQFRQRSGINQMSISLRVRGWKTA